MRKFIVFLLVVSQINFVHANQSKGPTEGQPVNSQPYPQQPYPQQGYPNQQGGYVDTSGPGRQPFMPGSASCPFVAAGADTTALLNRVQSALRTLDNETRNCPAVQQAISGAQNSLQALQRSQAQQVFSTDSSRANCANYEDRLRRGYDVAVASLNNQIPSSGYNVYSRCASAPDSQRQGCAEEIYRTSLSEMVTSCGYQANDANNQVARDALENLTNLSTSLISNPGQCGEGAKQAIIQTAISQATAAASMAAGFGLAGMGIGIVGRLLSAAVGAFANRNSAQHFMEAIRDEQSRPSRLCLFYDVQKAALQCEKSIYQNARPVSQPSELCEQDRSGIAQLAQFTTQIRASLNATPEGATTEAQRRQRVIEASREFVTRLETQVSPGKTYINLLEDAGQTLAGSDSPADRVQAVELQRATALYSRMKANPPQTSEAANSQMSELSSLLMGYSVSDSEARTLNLPDALARYQALKAAGGTIAGNLNNAQAVNAGLQIGNAGAFQAQQAVANYADQTGLDLALSAMVTRMRREFVDYLKTLNRDYEAYKNTQSDPTARMQWLEPMLNLCMSTQGMSYFPDDDRQSRLRMRTAPGREYSEICEKFNCPGGELYQRFNPNDPAGQGTPVDRFQSYQCAMDRRLPAAKVKLRENLQRNGTICGS